METPPPRRHQDAIFSDSERILTANNTHFIGLSFLFLPPCFYLITTPIVPLFCQLLIADHVRTVSHESWENIRILMNLNQNHENHQNSVASIIFYILIVYLLSLCAISTITYSIHRGFSGKPVNFFTTVKSLTSTFIPIVTTAITAHSLIFLFVLTFLLFVQTNLMLVQNLGFVIDYNSNNFVWFSYIIDAILIVIVTYFLVDWSLAFVVVVVESKSGLSALRRSACLVKGMRWVSLELFLFNGILLGLTVWVPSDAIQALHDWEYVWFTMMITSMVQMFFIHQSIAATTVLYHYCKDFHGELGIDEFDEKVPLMLL